MNYLPIEIIKIIIEYKKKTIFVITSLTKLLYSFRKYLYINVNYNKIYNLKTDFQINLYNINKLPILNINKLIYNIKFSDKFNSVINDLP